MERLPNEIALNIFSFLDTPPHSLARIKDVPSASMLKRDPETQNQDLKNLSLVSKSFRHVVLPVLFRHVQWLPEVDSLAAFIMNPIPLLQFLEKKDLRACVETFTLLVDFVDKHAAESHDVSPPIRPTDLKWLFDQVFSVIEPLRFSLIAPPTTLAAFMSRMLFLEDAWSFNIPYHILSLSREVRDVPSVKGKENVTSTSPQIQPTTTPNNTTETSDASKANAQKARPQLSARRTRPPPCSLFTIRPWTSLLLNEGSSTKVYKTYEFFLRQPPSMLSALLGCGEFPNDQPLIPATITDFSYVAIFPLSSHFATLVRHLPKIKRLYVQLAPLASNRGFLDDRTEMQQIDPADLWMERDMSYGFVIRKMVAAANAANAPAANAEQGQAAPGSSGQPGDDNDEDDLGGQWAGAGVHFGSIISTSITTTNNNENWASLDVFESGDATADAEAWDRAVQALDQQGGLNQWWSLQDRGLIVRNRN